MMDNVLGKEICDTFHVLHNTIPLGDNVNFLDSSYHLQCQKCVYIQFQHNKAYPYWCVLDI